MDYETKFIVGCGIVYLLLATIARLLPPHVLRGGFWVVRGRPDKVDTEFQVLYSRKLYPVHLLLALGIVVYGLLGGRLP